MIKYIIIFFLFSICMFGQPNVFPHPIHVGMSFEEITTMFPTYQMSPEGWYGGIAYYNTILPGKLGYYFNANRCYAMQYNYSGTDSAESVAVLNQYINYVRTGMNGYVMEDWNRENPKYKHYWWDGKNNGLGHGAIGWSTKDKNNCYVWMSIFRSTNTGVNGPIPETKPKVKLQ